ncbi:MAG: sigma-E processing peptidase SpoIIGA [Peptococcaceae bacterium]
MPPKVNIYIDMVFLINFTMDFFILWATAKMGRLRTTFKRLCLGAFSGALYAILIFLPGLSLLNTILAKILCSLFMILVAFGFNNIRRFFKSAAYFYFVSFVMGGAVLGSMYLFETNPEVIETWNGIAVNVINFKTAWLLAGLMVAVVLGIWGAAYIRRNLQQGPWLVKAKVIIGEHIIEVDALVDTGNQLNDPITQEPVMIIEHRMLEKALPPEFIRILNKKEISSLDQQLNTLTGAEWQTRIRLVPFSSLGNQNGMLVALKPDRVIVKDGEKTYHNTKAVVGLYHLKLCSQGSYQALVHPDMLTEE